MGSAKMFYKLNELDRLVNDPDILLDAARVYDLLDELSSDDLLLNSFAQPQAPVAAVPAIH